MTDFSDIYAHDKIAAEEGTWTDIGHGIKVKVRAFDSAHTRALRKKLEEPYKALTKRGGEIPEEESNQINIKLLAGSSLLGWNLTEKTGETDSEGNPVRRPIPFSVDKAEALLTQEPRFTRDVIAALMADETFKKRAREEDAKNSVTG